MANGLEKQEQEEQPWQILEFYSGIGGMRYSLVRAGVNVEVVEAFDINDTANDVYQHNFGHRPYQRKASTFYNQVFDNQLLRSLGPLFGDANADETMFSELDEPQESRDTLLKSCEPIESFLEFKNCSDQSESNFGDTVTGSTNTEGILEKDEGNGYCSGIVDQYIVPLSLVERLLIFTLPKDFQFPQHISLRQRYALLGNSLSIVVVALLLKYLLAGSL